MSGHLVFLEREPASHVSYAYEVVRVLHRERSPLQEILVFENPWFGRVLALDGIVQLTERDEFVYHEMLAQVPLHAHPRPRRVAIIGGGDGGTLREVLKHPEVERAVLVEMDEAVVRVSRRFFPGLSAGFDDPRARIVIQEGSQFLRETDERFDLILVDSTDPIGPAEGLFTEEFFRTAAERLEEGMLVAQTESLYFHWRFTARVQRRLRRVFPRVDLYTVPLSTYPGNWWSFSVASQLHDPQRPLRPCRVPVRFYRPELHRRCFLPPSLYQDLLAERLPW